MNRSRENLAVTISADWHSPIISATIYLRVAHRGSIIADVITLNPLAAKCGQERFFAETTIHNTKDAAGDCDRRCGVVFDSGISRLGCGIGYNESTACRSSTCCICCRGLVIAEASRTMLVVGISILIGWLISPTVYVSWSRPPTFFDRFRVDFYSIGMFMLCAAIAGSILDLLITCASLNTNANNA